MSAHMTLFIQFSPTTCQFIPVGSKYSSNILFSNTFNLCSPLNITDKVSHLCKIKGNIMDLQKKCSTPLEGYGLSNCLIIRRLSYGL